MTIHTITPDNVIPEKEMNPDWHPALIDAHRYCRECGFHSYIMLVDADEGRALFILAPWDRPHMAEMKFRDPEHGGWGKL